MLRRLGCALSLALILLLLAGAAYVFHGPILTAVGGYLIRADPLAKADAVISLAAGYSYHRDIAAADLVLAGYAPLLVLTRNAEPLGIDMLRQRGVAIESEIDRRVRYMTELGLSPAAIVVLPDVVRSTFDEAEATAKWLRQERRPVGRLIIVTSAYHTRRAHYIFGTRLAGMEVEVLTHSARPAEFEAESWWQNRDTLREGFIEWQKMVFYWVRY